RGDLLFLRRHNALQRGIAHFVDAGLNRENSRKWTLDVLEPAGFEFALEFQVSFDSLNGHDKGRMGPVEKGCKQHTCLAKPLVVTLQSGQNQISVFVFDRRGERPRRSKRIELREMGISYMDAAVGALG